MTVFFLQAPPAAGANGSMMWIMLIAMIAIMYFFMIRPQNKKQKEIKRQREAMKTGDRVVTAGGIHGRLRDVKDATVTMEVAPGVTLKVDKTSVFPAVEEAAPAKKEKKAKEVKEEKEEKEDK